VTTLDSMSKMIHQNAVAKRVLGTEYGGQSYNILPKQIAMIHSECSEVLEAI